MTGQRKRAKLGKPQVLWVQLDPGTSEKVPTKGCDDVSDFRGAIKKRLSPALDSVPLHLISLSLSRDGPALRPGLLLSDIPSMPEYQIIDDSNPLFVKILRENQSLTPFSPPMDSLGVETHRTDGIDPRAEHLKRDYLVDKLNFLLSKSRIVLLCSPPASGKSSLLRLHYESVKHDHYIHWISCSKKVSLGDALKQIGIDLERRKVTMDSKNTVIYLDDAQRNYDDVDFWFGLVKHALNWLPDHIKFVISATYSVTVGESSSPVAIRNLPRMTHEDFLLSDKEANELLDLPVIGLRQSMRSPKLKELIMRECGGLIGAIRILVDSLVAVHGKYDNPPEVEMLQYCLSSRFMNDLERCFGTHSTEPMSESLSRILRTCILEKKVTMGSLNPQEVEACAILKKAGILLDVKGSKSVFYSSPLAKRFFFRYLFPKRCDSAPSTLRDLIESVISKMSAGVLKRSTVRDNFPKESVFQHMFLNGLAESTPPDCSICPELSEVFPENSNTVAKEMISGEIDFYLDGSLRWGIELLANGSGVGEHLDRFNPHNGKYSPLGMNDYAVVDLRGTPTGETTGIKLHDKRITVFFKFGDYSRAQCIFGADQTPVIVDLSP